MYEFKTHNFIFHQIPDEVVTYLYVLRLWILNRILREIYSTSFVIEYTHCILRNLVVVKQLLHLEKLCATAPSNYILCFRRREGHRILLPAHSRDKIVPKVETTTWSTFTVISNHPHSQPNLHLNNQQAKHLNALSTTSHTLVCYWHIVWFASQQLCGSPLERLDIENKLPR